MKTFDSNYIENELEKINKNLSKQIRIYIFGGGAMSFFDLKTATKDIDVILISESEANELIKSLYKTGYNKIQTKDLVYINMKTREIIENKDGFRWDIFVSRVCGGLLFSKDMQKRAKPFKNLSNIKTYLVSPEDIFIFKAVTSRPRDREDMFSLFSHGLDAGIIRSEILNQAQLDEDKAWLSFFFVGLDELVSEYNIIFPEYNEFLKIAEEEMLEQIILKLIRKKPRSINDLLSILKCEREEIRPILKDLMSSNKISLFKEKYRLY